MASAKYVKYVRRTSSIAYEGTSSAHSLRGVVVKRWDKGCVHTKTHRLGYHSTPNLTMYSSGSKAHSRNRTNSSDVDVQATNP